MYKILRPLLFTLPPEAAHRAGMLALRLGKPFLPFLPLRFNDPKLSRKIFGLTFPNPVGLAAGFDKHAEAPDAWQHLGFGFAELGTFTRFPQPGNDRPRVWRYPRAKALLNRFGFNNPGAEEAAKRLGRLKASGAWPEHPLGLNLGKSKITPADDALEDYLFSLQAFSGCADYFAINVSSPNTPGLRSLQAKGAIKKLVGPLVKAARKTPLLVKFAPDMKDKDLLASCDAALAAGAKGLILTNTTLSREGLGPGPHPEGGMSGAPLRARANACLALVARHTKGRVPLIGVGGILTPADARLKLEMGAWLVQVYTGFIYEGPAFASKICRKLVDN